MTPLPLFDIGPLGRCRRAAYETPVLLLGDEDELDPELKKLLPDDDCEDDDDVDDVEDDALDEAEAAVWDVPVAIWPPTARLTTPKPASALTAMPRLRRPASRSASAFERRGTAAGRESAARAMDELDGLATGE